MINNDSCAYLVEELKDFEGLGLEYNRVFHRFKSFGEAMKYKMSLLDSNCDFEPTIWKKIIC